MLDALIITGVVGVILLTPGFLMGMLASILTEMRAESPSDYARLQPSFVKKVINIHVLSWWWDMPGFQIGYRF